MSLLETLWKMGRAAVRTGVEVVLDDKPHQQAEESWRTAYAEACKDLENAKHRTKQARESAALAWKGPRVGVACILRNYRGEVLFMQRAGAHGAGTWSIPGGAVERGETPLGAVHREVNEEVGLHGIMFRMLPVWTFNEFSELPWWVTLYAIADVPPGLEPRICEPTKCTALKWHALGDAPEPLFKPLLALVDAGVNLWTVGLYQRDGSPPMAYNRAAREYEDGDASEIGVCPHHGPWRIAAAASQDTARRVEHCPACAATDGQCEGKGQCHGCMSWCSNCGDVHHVCPDAQNCDSHRPAEDEWIDGAILSALAYSNGRKLGAVMESVWSGWDAPAAPISEMRIRERYEVLLRNDRVRLDVDAKGQQVVALPKDHEWAPKAVALPKPIPPDVY